MRYATKIKLFALLVILWLLSSYNRRHDEHAFAIKLMIGIKLQDNCFLFLSLSDLELEELEAPQRYRPDSLASICKTTKFSEPEIKRMYRGFKAHCPNGMVREDTFKLIYAQFFPQGGKKSFSLTFEA